MAWSRDPVEIHDALNLEQADVCQLVLQLCVIPVGHSGIWSIAFSQGAGFARKMLWTQKRVKT